MLPACPCRALTARGQGNKFSMTEGKESRQTKTKTLPTQSRERNEESCGDGRRIVVVPVIVEPVVVPIPPVAVPIEVTDN